MASSQREMTVEGGGLRRDSVGGGVRMEEELWRCSWIRDRLSTREARTGVPGD